MCSCGKFTDSWLAGVQDGAMEIHTPDVCRTQRMARWWTRIVYAIGAWLTNLAGRDARAATLAYEHWQSLWQSAHPSRQRNAGRWRAVLSDVYEKRETRDE